MTYADLFTPRQMVALTTFSDLVSEVRTCIERDAVAAGLPVDARGLDNGGTGAKAYAEAVSVYLGLSISKLSDAQSSLCRWKITMDQSIATFGRQALPIIWDYCEANAFGEMAGDPLVSLKNMMRALVELPAKPMTVRTALQLINRFLAEDDFDADTQFCLHWFEQHGWETGKFGEADTLGRAKGTSVAGVQQSGVIESGAGNVRLLKWKEYPADWDPATDARLPIWEALHQLIRAYNTEGDSGAALVLKGVEAKAEAARQLAYRLYTLCERRGWAEDWHAVPAA